MTRQEQIEAAAKELNKLLCYNSNEGLLYSVKKMKPREFWIKTDWISGCSRAGALNFDLSELLNKGSKDLEFHVREVVPIDWREIWTQWTGNPIQVPCFDYLKIQELVEKALRNEL